MLERERHIANKLMDEVCQDDFCRIIGKIMIISSPAPRAPAVAVLVLDAYCPPVLAHWLPTGSVKHVG